MMKNTHAFQDQGRFQNQGTGSPFRAPSGHGALKIKKTTRGRSLLARRSGVGVASLILVGLLTGCGGGSKTGSTGSTSTPSPGVTTNTPNTQTNGLKAQRTVTPETYGASGSEKTVQCTATAGSNQWVCPAGTEMDFAINHGVMVPLAGKIAHGFAVNMAAPVVQQSGNQTGSSTYCYKVVVADSWAGLQMPSGATCLSNQPADLSVDHNHMVSSEFSFETQYITQQIQQGGTPSRNQAIPYYLWYVSKDGANYELFATSLSPKPQSEIANAHNTYRSQGDFGGWPRVIPSGLAASEGVWRRGKWFSEVTAVSCSGGMCTLTMKDPARISGTFTVYHDDTLAFQRALDALAPPSEPGAMACDTATVRNCTGGVLQLGAKTYLMNRPTFATLDPNDFYIGTDETTRPLLASSYFSVLHLHPKALRDITIQGVEGPLLPVPSDGLGPLNGPSPSVIKTQESFVSVYWLNAMAPISGLTGGVGWTKNSNFDTLPAPKGAMQVTLKDPSQASRLVPGMDVWLYHGNFGVMNPVEPGFQPCVANSEGQVRSCHFSQLNTIERVEGGVVTLKMPLIQPLVDDGVDDIGFIPGDNIWIHNLTLKNLTFDSQHGFVSPTTGFNVSIEGFTGLQVLQGNAMSTGYKRGFKIHNSSYKFGCNSRGWSCVQEYDQLNDFTITNSQVEGFSAPDYEGPSQGSNIFLSEGASDMTFHHNRFIHTAIQMQVANNVWAHHNEFRNSTIWVGQMAQDPYTAYPALDYLSYGNQESARIEDNVMTFDPSYRPFQGIRLGTFTNGYIGRNTVRLAASQPYAWSIVTSAGVVENNTVIREGLGYTSMVKNGMIGVVNDLENHPMIIQNNTLQGPGIWTIDGGGALKSKTGLSICVRGNTVNGVARNNGPDFQVDNGAGGLMTYNLNTHCPV